METLIQTILALIGAMDQKQVRQAIELALERHAGQSRIGGEPHAAHVLRVGLAAGQWAKNNWPEMLVTLTLVGILHDTLEDTPTSDEELATLFGDEVARAVRALSHVEEEEPEAAYYARVKAGGRLAVVVKRMDRLDNFACLHSAPEKFQRKVLRLQSAALPIWREMDPEGYSQIAAALQEIERRLAKPTV